MKDVCQLCTHFDFCENHRIRPGKEGGQYIPDNVIRICRECHRKVHLVIRERKDISYGEAVDVVRVWVKDK